MNRRFFYTCLVDVLITEVDDGLIGVVEIVEDNAFPLDPSLAKASLARFKLQSDKVPFVREKHAVGHTMSIWAGQWHLPLEMCNLRI